MSTEGKPSKLTSASTARTYWFASGPDSFAVSQSWGWKSTSLRSEEYLGAGAGGKWDSLRCTIVMGVI
ncbi:hypothetical protein BT69DRAFT_435043 [Atractiella rhizophila]|nr:hypothetical protein BT69DRAFT_435043 [Atractiella rhizophila]